MANLEDELLFEQRTSMLDAWTTVAPRLYDPNDTARRRFLRIISAYRIGAAAYSTPREAEVRQLRRVRNLLADGPRQDASVVAQVENLLRTRQGRSSLIRLHHELRRLGDQLESPLQSIQHPKLLVSIDARERAIHAVDRVVLLLRAQNSERERGTRPKRYRLFLLIFMAEFMWRHGRINEQPTCSTGQWNSRFIDLLIDLDNAARRARLASLDYTNPLRHLPQELLLGDRSTVIKALQVLGPSSRAKMGRQLGCARISG